MIDAMLRASDIPRGEVKWFPDLVARGLGLKGADLLEALDGRVMGLLLEPVLCHRVIRGELSARGDPWDATDDQGRKYEIRALTGSISFAPSSCRGTGRKFDRAKFLGKVDELDFFLVGDAFSFSLRGGLFDRREDWIRWWLIPAETIKGWESCILRGDGSLSRARFLEVVDMENL